MKNTYNNDYLLTCIEQLKNRVDMLGEQNETRQRDWQFCTDRISELANRIESLEDVLNKTVLPEPMPRIEPEKPKEAKESELLNILINMHDHEMLEENAVIRIRRLAIEKVKEYLNSESCLKWDRNKIIKKLEEM